MSSSVVGNRSRPGRKRARLTATVAIVVALTSCGADSGGGEPTSDGSDPTRPRATAVTSTSGSPSPSTTTIPSATATTAPDTTSPESTAPSQTPADARRDGVVLALAALPYASRVSPFDAESGSRTIEIGSTRWLISRLPPDRIERLTDGCLLGDPTGTYGDDYVCLSTYAEILQIDTETERIIRAYPFPELPPQQLLLADEAIYCVRQGDGGVPDSMLCRIDPDNGDALVRVFPDTSSSWFVDETTWTPPNWIIDDPTDLVLWQTLEATDSSLTITGSDGTASVDPDTLELLTDQ